MLTRLRIQGFKNLLDVDLRFGPFTCMAGNNGAGKSNIFDAIRFLSLLAQHPIMEAAQLLRTTSDRSFDVASLFTAFQGYVAPEMRFIADLIVERKVEDDFGVESEAAISSVRYEVAFVLNREDGHDRLELREESLLPIKLTDAGRNLGFPNKPVFRKSCIAGRRPAAFVSTKTEPHGITIQVHQEGSGGRKLSAPKSSRTVVGGMASSDHPTILAANREMASWQTLMLEPSAMRAASLCKDPQYIDMRGANLPATVSRLAKRDSQPGRVCAELANMLAMLLEDVQELKVRDDATTETLTLEVCGRDGVFHPAKSLSDGALRFLVLAVLSLDAARKGMICLEEPENGMHPERIPAIVELLKDFAVDPDLKVDEDNPLRQVVVNTHSPGVIRCLSPNDVVCLQEEHIRYNGDQGNVSVTTVPTPSWRSGSQCNQRLMSRGEMRSYFEHQTKAGQLWLDFLGE